MIFKAAFYYKACFGNHFFAKKWLLYPLTDKVATHTGETAEEPPTAVEKGFRQAKKTLVGKKKNKKQNKKKEFLCGMKNIIQTVITAQSRTQQKLCS